MGNYLENMFLIDFLNQPTWTNSILTFMKQLFDAKMILVWPLENFFCTNGLGFGSPLSGSGLVLTWDSKQIIWLKIGLSDWGFILDWF